MNRAAGDSVMRRLASRIANGIRNRLSNETIQDSGCTFRAFRRECLRELPLFRGFHRFIPTLLRMRGYRVVEVPVTCYAAGAGGLRHVQINGCSGMEMRQLLLRAWRRCEKTLVIVAHSFELLNTRKDGPDPVVVSRFKNLCRFLAAHPDKFRTAGFADLDAAALLGAAPETPLRATWPAQITRLGGQALRRFF